MRPNYSGSRDEHLQDSIQGRRQLSILLKVAPRLPTLSLILKCFSPYHDPSKRAANEDCIRVANAIADNESDELEVLELDDMAPFVRNLSDSLRLLEKSPKLKTTRLSLHADLLKHKCVPSADVKDTVTPLDYISSNKRAIEDGWEVNHHRFRREVCHKDLALLQSYTAKQYRDPETGSTVEHWMESCLPVETIHVSRPLAMGRERRSYSSYAQFRRGLLIL